MIPAEQGMSIVDVVVPAQDEAASLAACLRAVLVGAGDLDVRIVVVANGCSDRTADVARQLAADLTGPGREFLVLELDRPGKAAALRAGHEHLRNGVLVHLDADTILLPGSLRAMVLALRQRRTAAFSSPRPLVVRPDGRLARGWCRIWVRLPSVDGDVIGAGCYAANVAGRSRILGLPDVVADDAWARSRFAPEERLVTDPGFLLVLPDWPELPAVLGRWRRGNAALGGRSPSAGLRAVLGFLLLRPQLWTSLPAYLAVLLASGQVARADRWSRSEKVRRCRNTVAVTFDRPRVRALVVTHNSRRLIDACLDSLRSELAELRVTVVDSGSVDGTVEHVARSRPGVTLIAHDRNLGFAAGVNRGAAGLDEDFLMLVNPDCRLEPTTVDVLLTTAQALGRRGMVGGLAFDGDGRPDRTSCLGAPTLWHSVTFGTGLSMAHGVPCLDPDSLGGWRRTGIRAVPVLTAALLLVDGRSWHELGGFDDSYVLYGEDVDLCVRARRAGLGVTFTEHARYVHLGGGSSSAQDRMRLIMKGKATLVRRQLAAWKIPVARTALVAGVGLRALLESAIRRNPRVWGPSWRDRRDWSRGWPRVRTVAGADGVEADQMPAGGWHGLGARGTR